MVPFFIQSGLPYLFWVEAAFVVVFTINRLPTPTLAHQSPFQKLFGRVPDYIFLRTFGCECFPNFSACSSNKLQLGPFSVFFLVMPINIKDMF